ncbi:hypothetical protein [Agromyces salentinus]|uniref:Tat pathway signal sequence domain protein n=1 Tax=Agromyces salentinus TaxID=269421 RepID=A0ABN2MEI9_9MICO|nr:hypothetical protein [Agromyces salentinus]
MSTNTASRRRRLVGTSTAIAASIALVLGTPSIAQAAPLAQGLYKAPWESCVFEVDAASNGGGVSYVSADRWKALGYPAVTASQQFALEKSYIFKNGTSSHEIFADTSRFTSTPCGVHKLTFAEWQAMGSPTPVAMNPQFYKLNGSATIYGRMFTLGSTYVPSLRAITYAEWTELGFPTPQVVSKLP